MSDCTVTFVTCASQEEAEKIAETLVRERLAACVNIVPAVTSIYFWQGSLCKETERLLVIKSTLLKQEQLQSRVRALHSYTVPEIVSWPLPLGNPDYLRWVEESTR